LLIAVVYVAQCCKVSSLCCIVVI